MTARPHPPAKAGNRTLNRPDWDALYETFLCAFTESSVHYATVVFGSGTPGQRPLVWVYVSAEIARYKTPSAIYPTNARYSARRPSGASALLGSSPCVWVARLQSLSTITPAKPPGPHHRAIAHSHRGRTAANLLHSRFPRFGSIPTLPAPTALLSGS